MDFDIEELKRLLNDIADVIIGYDGSFYGKQDVASKKRRVAELIDEAFGDDDAQ